MNQKKKVFVGADHAGFDLKQILIQRLTKIFANTDFVDCGCQSHESVDYPVYVERVVKQVSDTGHLGILICGSGIGMCIGANKFKGIMAAVAWNRETARLSRSHNHANVLCLGARQLDQEEALKIAETWLKTEFEGGRHERRVGIIRKWEEES